MKSYAQYQLEIAQQIRQHEIEEAQAWRIARAGRIGRSQSIKRAIGRSIIGIGERLAAEPSIQPARSIR
jgi:hypothetical protein